VAVPARRDGFGPRLDDVKTPVEPVLRPFHVHRPFFAGDSAVMVLDRDRLPRERQNFFVAQAELLALLRVGWHVARRRQPALREDHLELLRPELALEHASLARTIGRL